MDGSTYKLIDIVGTSSVSLEDAIRLAIRRAGSSLRGMSWFEVGEIRGRIQGEEVEEFQVTLKIGFRLESSHPA